MKKVVVFFAAAALSIASAAQTHKLVLFQDSWVNGQELKSGEYRLIVDGSKAIIAKGKEKVEANITSETAESKFNSTSVRYQNGDGKYRVKEIRIGGTNTRLVFQN